MTSPADILQRLLADDPAAPRITCYDDTPGPTQGERIELSAKVLANWVSKAANALQEEWDAEPGTVVALALPPHWRTLCWALAVWSVGACVSLDDPSDADVVITDDPELLESAGIAGALVTLAGLARRAPVPVPSGAMDEAQELATYPDAFEAWAEPDGGDPALRAGGDDTAYAQVVPAPLEQRGARVHTATSDTGTFVAQCLSAYAAGGSVVLSRGAAADRAARLDAEAVTIDLGQ
ncbi:MAG: TIGR03089 family protein [Micrococcales bacterium]|nr:TIGR03089 family protein [Micrococcales bacterium]